MTRWHEQYRVSPTGWSWMKSTQPNQHLFTDYFFPPCLIKTPISLEPFPLFAIFLPEPLNSAFPKYHRWCCSQPRKTGEHPHGKTCCLSAHSVLALGFEVREFFSPPTSAQNVSWRQTKEHSGNQSRSRSEGNNHSHEQSPHSFKTNLSQNNYFKYFSIVHFYISPLVASFFKEVDK